MTTFGGQVFQPVPLERFGENGEELRQAIRDLIPTGRSVLYDGVQSGFSEISALEDDSRINAVVVLAEGGDDGSSTTLENLRRELADACAVEGVAIPVVTVAYGNEADTEALNRIAGACKGRALTATPGDIVEVLRRTALLF